MYKDPIQMDNLMNLIITSNNDAIRVSRDDRRYVVLDTNNSMKGNTKHFNNLLKITRNDLVGEAFFAFLVKTYDPYFNSTEIPETESKAMQIAENVPLVIQFIKDHLLRHRRGLEMPAQEFKDILKSTYPKKRLTDGIIKAQLAEISVSHRRKMTDLGKRNVYEEPVESLFKKIVDKGFIHKDEILYQDMMDEESETPGASSSESQTSSEVHSLTEENSKLKEEIQRLKAQLAKLQKPKKSVGKTLTITPWST